MDNWERFNKTSSDKNDIYSSLNNKGIINEDDEHVKKRVWKDFKKIKKLN